MKKILVFALALTLCLFAVACSANNGDANSAIVKFMEDNGAEFTQTMESAIVESTGLECTTKTEVIGNGIVIDINIQGLNDIDDMTKALLQAEYDDMNASFEAELASMQKDLPELEYLTLNVNEEDGDLLAQINVGNK